MDLDPTTTPDGLTRYVDRGDAERGSLGPFYAVYPTPEATARWGYYCSACGSVDNAMDTMGRLVCNDCPNQRKPEEWDAAHE